MFPTIAAVVVIFLLVIVVASLARTKRGAFVPPLAPGASPEERIRNLLAQGRKIEAIRLYRETTGLGLKESKDAVDRADRTGQIVLPGGSRAVPAADDPSVEALVRAGKKIEAIALYRRTTGASLIDAKNAVERMDVR